MSLFPRVGEGVCAEFVIGEHHLRLFCTESGLGPVAGLFNVKTNQWIGTVSATDIEDGRDKAEQLAMDFFRHNVPADTPFPVLEWKKTG